MWPSGFRARGLRNSSGPSRREGFEIGRPGQIQAPCCQPGMAPLPPRLPVPARARRGAGHWPGHRAGLRLLGALASTLRSAPRFSLSLRSLGCCASSTAASACDSDARCAPSLLAQGGALVRPIEGRRRRRWDSESECAGGAAGVVRWRLSVRWERPPLRENRRGILRCTAPKDGSPGTPRSPSRLPGPSGSVCPPSLTGKARFVCGCPPRCSWPQRPLVSAAWAGW
jgi:hypothetical protein